MRKTLQTLLLTMLIMLPCMIVNADPYPETMDTGNLVLVDGGMGVGSYADKSSVAVQTYDPPNYQIASLYWTKLYHIKLRKAIILTNPGLSPCWEWYFLEGQQEPYLECTL